MHVAPTSQRIRLGRCTLDEERGVLAAPDGTETALRPKTLVLLRLLLDNAGRVVARAAILDAVWPGLFVTDDSITQCVAELRKAMGDAGPGILRTVPRRGYLLQAETMRRAAPPAPSATAKASLPRPADGRPAIIVLPFHRDPRDRREAYLTDGIIEGIVNALARLEGLSVISRGSSLAFAQVTTDARAAARELGTRYVLYCGVRRAGGRLRIATELTDAERATILRSDCHDETESDLFTLQDRIAARVVAAVAPWLREHEARRVLRARPAHPTAYALVLRALEETHRLDRPDLERARELLERAAGASGTPMPLRGRRRDMVMGQPFQDGFTGRH